MTPEETENMNNIRYATYQAMQDELLSTKSSAPAEPEPEQPEGYIVEVHIRADDADDARGRVAGILLPYSAYTTGARRDTEARGDKVIADLYDVASDAEADVLLRLRGRAGHIAEHSRDTRCRQGQPFMFTEEKE